MLRGNANIMEYLDGTIERITFSNEQNGFGVIKVRVKGDSDLITAVGTLPSVNIGATVCLKGEWKNNSKYGKQFNVYEYTETVPATAAGIEKYLGSGFIKGIGPVNAKRIVKKFGEDTIRIIEEQPDRLIEVSGIGSKRIEIIKAAWQEHKEIKNVMLFLQTNGVSTAYSVKIFKAYGNESIRKVRENPFKLADDIWGIGFITADRIAQNLGFDKNSYERCRAGIVYAMNEFSNDGHCYAKRQQLVEAAMQLLGVEGSIIDFALEKMVLDKTVIYENEDAFYLPPFYFSEIGTVKRIKQIISVRSMFQTENIDDIVKQVEQEHGIHYDEVQLEAVKAAAISKFMVLTGGPGTGKTTTTLAILRVFCKLGARVLLAAPTGRAAKRMSEVTGMEAKTIHRLLEYKPPEGYRRNRDNMLDCDALIVDEASMVDIILMYNLLQAVPDNAIVILVGDADQLPSVGAGNVLKDVIESGIVQVIHLKRIFRQAQGSAIVMNAHRINNGEFPGCMGGENRDFFFIEQEDPEKIVDTIKDLCSKRLPEYYGVNPISDIQVLCPMQKGETGVLNLNTVLQETLNPSERFIKHGATKYRINDKVMQIKNNYDKNVFNGDIGTIIDIDWEDRILIIRFDEQDVVCDITEMDEVVLAYATTIHKSQGSEYPIVVAPISIQHYIMLARNLLYTCVTRAKKVLVLVGTKKAIRIAVSNDKTKKRNTMLSERLRIGALTDSCITM